MPRRRKSDLPSVKRRTRTGCQTCRQRKIKCDEDKPTCGQCRLKCLPCVTAVSLKWEEEYQVKGLAFGRARAWTKDPVKGASPISSSPASDDIATWCHVPHVYAYSFVNATVGALQEFTTLDYDAQSSLVSIDQGGTPPGTEGNVDDASKAASLSSWLSKSRLVRSQQQSQILPSLGLLPQLRNPDASLLLSYYLEHICPMTMPTRVSTSPFATLLVPFSITTSSLALDALLALAACHRSRSNPAYTAMGLQLSDRALRNLRSKLSHDDPREVANSSETLVVMMLLCLFEIVKECDKRWVVHLKGARDLIRIRRNTAGASNQRQPADSLVLFCQRFFAYHDVIGRTACGEDTIFETDFWTSSAKECDAWLGCSPELVSILSETNELSRRRRANPAIASLDHFKSAAALLGQRLASLEQKVWNLEDTILATSAELKRLAAELYLHCALYGATPSTPYVTEHIGRILPLVSRLLAHQVVAGLSWPLFVAAVELDPHQDVLWFPEEGGMAENARPFVLYALHQLSGSMVNVSRTRSVIEKVWQARELHDWAQTPAEEGQNDWEQFVAPLCGNMSLG
ncbi:hypothetical protein A1O1_06519 [Capronia coronata CBS 617.96]|uniref:Zn(2)-C6 fungal-type domain-containing protein n=1 Tax=Capronia coronata CBS 617.96 TaxID=1182541 RepID=W9YV39_9EURO|nr:uncharacterized protein A1O1_06519 [Capronia coronata CBS 617.96]EXJ86149.1 hypothetical protein A1O1_06519 [Capronia coronata CBS 617.96]